MYGIKSIRTQCAPHRNTLIKFGGELTDEEFRSHAVSPITPVLTMPDRENFIHKLVVMDDTPLYNQSAKTPISRHEDNKRLADINSSSIKTQKTDSLRLKRPVPIKLSANNIESALGLTRKPTC
tara:strand:+ start:359 stop:730 length:372 start_codon:yes stop_codon:yes gene_type:complete